MSTPPHAREAGAIVTNTPLSIATTTATGGVVSSPCGTAPGTTVTSRGRVLNTQYQKEVTSATVKEVDVVRRGLRCVETRIHQLESRVQHVNPWVVQHMWETLCELRDKVGLEYDKPDENVWMEGTHSGNIRSSRCPGAVTQTKGTSSSFLKDGTKGTQVQRGRSAGRLNDNNTNDANNLNTLVSSESDDNSSSGLCGAGTVDAGSSCSFGAASKGMPRPHRRESLAKSVLRVVRQLPSVECQWVFWRLEQQEYTARQRIALDENTYRNTLLVHLAGRLSTASTVYTVRRHSKMVVSPSRKRGKQKQRGRRGMYESSVLDTDSSSDEEDVFTMSNWSGSKDTAACGRSCDNTTAQLDSVIGVLLNDHSFMEQITSNVSQRLASLIEQSDSFQDKDMSPKNALPSALLLAIGDTVEKFAKSHHESLYRQVQGYLTQQRELGRTQEERLWSCIAEHEAAWSRRATEDRAVSCELLEQQQRFLALGKEDVESCHEVRRELLKLCAEVIHATERVSTEASCTLVPSVREDRAERSQEVRSTQDDALELRLDVLSASVAQLHGELEGLRLKTEAAEILSGVKSTESTQGKVSREQEKQLSFLRAAVEDMRQTISVLVQNSSAAEEWAAKCKVDDTQLRGIIDKQKRMEDEIRLIVTASGATLPMSLPSHDIQAGATPPSGVTAMYPISVEDAVLNAQHTLLAVVKGGESPKAPYARALSALCTTLQHISDLYKLGTGTFGSCLRLVLSSDPSSLPFEIGTVCQNYLCKHSASELKEAIQVLNVNQMVGKILRDCYRWIQSHVLVFYSFASGRHPLSCEASSGDLPLAHSKEIGPSPATQSEGFLSSKRTVTPQLNNRTTQGLPQPRNEVDVLRGAPHDVGCAGAVPFGAQSVGGRDRSTVYSDGIATQHLRHCEPQAPQLPSTNPTTEEAGTEHNPLRSDGTPDLHKPLIWCPSVATLVEASQSNASQWHAHHSANLSLISGIHLPSHAKDGTEGVQYTEQSLLSDITEYPALVVPSANCSHIQPKGESKEKHVTGYGHLVGTLTMSPVGLPQSLERCPQSVGCSLHSSGSPLAPPSHQWESMKDRNLVNGSRAMVSDHSISTTSNREGRSQGITLSPSTPAG
ncbi:uncharacterized protein TEOVI_000422600 [Trypanosoma equiperdum]|uniref:Uncharacterized protein n=1 Tax=Trypanosoma equiperdum TaxID=5694 RepID=A0A1G4IJD9_TRYEQ|nr:hypothetical protein, conserved [Trypanosoma equiperdum]